MLSEFICAPIVLVAFGIIGGDPADDLARLDRGSADDLGFIILRRLALDHLVELVSRVGVLKL